jgi:hypothetical protein
VFVEQENIVCTLKWPNLIAKNEKKSSFYKEKKFGRIDSWQRMVILMTLETELSTLFGTHTVFLSVL